MQNLRDKPGHRLKVRDTQLTDTDPRDRYREKIARITLDSMVQFVGLLDAEGTVVEINHVALHAVGITLAEVAGKPFWTTFWWQVSPEINAELREMIRRAATGEFVRWDTEIYGRAGGRETIIIDASLMPVKDEHGTVVFICAEGRDITEKKAYEREIARQREELAELDRLKTQFFANISHEFRTPLTLMLGPLADALAEADGLPPGVRERLELAHRNAVRQLKLVNTLLDFSRIEAGRIEASYAATDLGPLTAELASVFRSAIEKAGLRLVVDCPALPEPVWVDREMWEKIVLNLISNAFKFTFEGEIRVGLATEGDAVTLSVTDTGTGIPAEDLPRLFERFHRVKDARGRSFEGSGIGLALVQELARLHGGEVRVESELDRGSRFTVTIPRGQAHLPAGRLGAPRVRQSTGIRAEAYVEEVLRWVPAGPAAGAESAAGTAGSRIRPRAPAGPARIVLADDNADMREYVARLLTGGGYQVEAVADGRSALETVRASPPDLVLADVMMPGLDGFELLRALRSAELGAVPVILLSARAGEDARVEGLEAGADDYLVKPFSGRELLSRVDSHIRLQQVRREASEALGASRMELQTLLNEAPIGVVLIDGDFRIREVNPAARPSFGDLPGLIGRDFGEVMRILWTQPYAEEVIAIYRHTLETGKPYYTPERIERRLDRGVTEYYEWQVNRIPLPEGGYGVVCYFRDISAQVWARAAAAESQAQLRQAAKMEAIGRLAGGLAHDFNNQLYAVGGFANFVARENSLSPQARHDVLEIQKAAERMASLTRQLLAFSRQQVLQPETLDLNEAVRETQSMLQRLLGSHIPIEATLASEPLWTKVDRSQLLQVLMNLAINARDAMPEGGQLALTTGLRAFEREEFSPFAGTKVAPGRYAVLTATDSGTGIAAADLPHIFEPFFTTKEIGQGTGLGLATVLGIVSQSQGHVWAESAPDGGARFTVLLPLTAAPAAAASASIGGDAVAAPRGRVLVVDDEEQVRTIVTRALAELGYQVTEARHGEDALKQLEAAGGGVDVVLSDVVMPVLGGIQLARRLAERWPALPVVWMSGYTRDAAFGDGVARDNQPFLQKPIEEAVLAEVVAGVVERGAR
ncbi:MAG TPA: response regulator [Gemmatimonadales bacterium]|nr:response regulator [Gemmatimonadales bacterium]